MSGIGVRRERRGVREDEHVISLRLWVEFATAVTRTTLDAVTLCWESALNSRSAEGGQGR